MSATFQRLSTHQKTTSKAPPPHQTNHPKQSYHRHPEKTSAIGLAWGYLMKRIASPDKTPNAKWAMGTEASEEEEMKSPLQKPKIWDAKIGWHTEHANSEGPLKKKKLVLFFFRVRIQPARVLGPNANIKQYIHGLQISRPWWAGVPWTDGGPSKRPGFRLEGDYSKALSSWTMPVMRAMCWLHSRGRLCSRLLDEVYVPELFLDSGIELFRGPLPPSPPAISSMELSRRRAFAALSPDCFRAVGPAGLLLEGGATLLDVS